MKTVARIGALVCMVAGIAMLVMWGLSGGAPARLEIQSVVVRKALMSFGYKVYANPEVADGRYFLGKVVLKNSGGRPVHDLAISYQVPDYIGWTTPEVTKVVPGGSTVVHAYYPKFPASIATLNNQTTATLEIKIQWREAVDGPLKEEVRRDNFAIRGVNEVQYSDLPADEIATWYDQWTTAQFVVCMVTPNDPYVKEFTAEITKRMGGSMAGVTRTPQEVAELMKATYDYMIETGMRYAGAKGVPEKIGDVQTLVQSIRLPRDVIKHNQGLCIELAILWAAVMDQLGCESYIVLRPGHAYTIVVSQGQSFPIECTAITPKAVGSATPVAFAQAVEMAMKDLNEQPLKMLLSVRQYQSDGYASPELPDVDIDKIKAVLNAPDRVRQAAPQVVVVQQGGQPQWNGQTGPAGPLAPPHQGGGALAGIARYDHRAGLVSFSYPQTWQMQPAVAQIGNTFAVGDLTTQAAVQVYEVPNVDDPNTAMSMIAQAIGQFGSQVMVQDSRTQGNVTAIQGITLGPGGQFQWQGVFRTVPGGVIGIVAGAPAQTYEANRAAFNQILGTIQFKQ
jgi:hypothetical protein